MHVFIVYAHPSQDSFTAKVRDEFIRGLEAGGHAHELSDLYRMGFRTDMSEQEYLREANYDDQAPVPDDVAAEQAKLNRSDAVVFIYPVFWTESPAKLVGWFDRVWTWGFAYGERRMKKLKRALVICVAGHTMEHLKGYGHYDAMRTVMLGDRIFDRAEGSELAVLDGMAKSDLGLRRANWGRHLQTAFALGRGIGRS